MSSPTLLVRTVRVALGAALSSLLLCGCGAQAPYVQYGDEQLAAGRPGQAMAAYDEHLDEHPGDEAVAGKRRQAAADWIRAQLPRARKLKGRDAVGMLLALGRVARDRGLDELAIRDIAPELDRAVARVWPPKRYERSTGSFEEVISAGEGLVPALPEDSKAREELARLKKEAAAFHSQASRSAKHPAAAYLHAALARRHGGEAVSAEVERRYQELTRPSYQLRYDVAKCGGIQLALDDRLEKAPLFPGSRPGVPIQVSVQLECEPFRERSQRRSETTCEEVKTHVHVMRSCRNRLRTSVSAGVHRSYDGSSYLVSTVTYTRVPECTDTRKRTTEVIKKTGTLLVEEEKVGIDVGGWVYYEVAGANRAFPLHARTFAVNKRWEGPCGKGERRGMRSAADPIVAHGLWGELADSTLAAQNELAELALGRARDAERSGDEDKALGEMIAAARLHEQVPAEVAKWFRSRHGMSKQLLKELFFDAARQPPLTRSFHYDLKMPQVDPQLKLRLQEQRLDSDDDGY